jgi:hypothetical protein
LINSSVQRHEPQSKSTAWIKFGGDVFSKPEIKFHRNIPTTDIESFVDRISGSDVRVELNWNDHGRLDARVIKDIPTDPFQLSEVTTHSSVDYTETVKRHYGATSCSALAYGDNALVEKRRTFDYLKTGKYNYEDVTRTYTLPNGGNEIIVNERGPDIGYRLANGTIVVINHYYRHVSGYKANASAAVGAIPATISASDRIENPRVDRAGLYWFYSYTRHTNAPI